MKRIAEFLIIGLILISSKGYCETFSQETFLSYLPSLGQTAEAITPETSKNNILLNQQFLIKGTDLNTFSKRYMNDLRDAGWQIRKYVRQPKGVQGTILTLEAFHPEKKQQLQIFITDAYDKNFEQMEDSTWNIPVRNLRVIISIFSTKDYAPKN